MPKLPWVTGKGIAQATPQAWIHRGACAWQSRCDTALGRQVFGRASSRGGSDRTWTVAEDPESDRTVA